MAEASRSYEDYAPSQNRFSATQRSNSSTSSLSERVQSGAADASLIIVALPEIEPAALAVSRIRAFNLKAPILARAHGQAEAERLAALGATEVIQPEFEASATLIRHALTWFGVPKGRILDYVEQYRQSMETTGKQVESAL